MMQRKSFTLVEMLVVISIVAILAALIMPVLSKALNTARDMSCLNNQKQISYALTSYIDNVSAGMVPNPLSNWGRNNGNAYVKWLDLLAMMQDPALKGDCVWMSKTDATGTIYVPRQPFGCPAQTAQEMMSYTCQRHYGINSYFASSDYAAVSTTPVIKRYLSRIQRPSQRAAFMDIDRGDLATWKNPLCNSLASMVADNGMWRHSGGVSANVSFADGHAVAMQAKDIPATYAANNGYFWYANEQ